MDKSHPQSKKDHKIGTVCVQYNMTITGKATCNLYLHIRYKIIVILNLLCLRVLFYVLLNDFKISWRCIVSPVVGNITYWSTLTKSWQHVAKMCNLRDFIFVDNMKCVSFHHIEVISF